jgi:hypothetical protein
MIRNTIVPDRAGVRSAVPADPAVNGLAFWTGTPLVCQPAGSALNGSSG